MKKERRSPQDAVTLSAASAEEIHADPPAWLGGGAENAASGTIGPTLDVGERPWDR
jgi:hypothetical protein